MIKDRKYRQKLIARYLEADTTVQEEIMLAEYYRTHKVGADEADVARLNLIGPRKKEPDQAVQSYIYCCGRLHRTFDNVGQASSGEGIYYG